MKRSSPASESRMLSTNGTFWNFQSTSMSWFWPISRSWKMIGAIQSMSDTSTTLMLFFLGPALLGVLGRIGSLRPDRLSLAVALAASAAAFAVVGGLAFRRVLCVGRRTGRRRRRRCPGRGRR